MSDVEATPADVAAPRRFSQGEVDRVVADRLRQQRYEHADAEDLQIRAAEVDRLERQAAEMEASIAELNRRTLITNLRVRHDISEEDAVLFLTGADDAALTAQAERLGAMSRGRTWRPAT
ncbi:hypothetical protein ACO03V_14495 [Microbacterium sp. HMH0099]|uniref:hypothetical protein n=1 Tax=Microbacterium sp. HMH0099 TaxID=3414026 RepID=UPI003BF6D660